MVVQAPVSATASPTYLGALDQRLSVRVRGICCLNNLGTVPHPSRKQLWNENTTPFPVQHNSPQRKRGE